jgi:ferric-dicitrate binding protein FerR (iron transport regulator)
LVAAEDGSGSIAVFAGTVEVEDRRSGQIRLVGAGERVTMDRDGTITDPSPYDRNSQRRWWEPD